MIAGLVSYVRDSGLASPFEGTAAVVGVAADGLVPETALSVLGSFKCDTLVVFDGPGKATPTRLDGLQRRRLLRLLVENNINYLVAPSLAAAQLCYLYKHQFISHVAFCDEAWLIEDVPLVINAGKPGTGWLAIPRHKFLSIFGLAPTEFRQCAVAAGCDVPCEPFDLLDKSMNPLIATINFAQLQGAGSIYGSGTMILGFEATGYSVTVEGAAYLSRFQQALGYLNWIPVLETSGETHLFPKTTRDPEDLHQIIGRRLPDSIYWAISKGILGPEPAAALIWGYFADDSHFLPSPANKDDTKTYRQAQGQLNAVRVQALGLVLEPLNRYFKFAQITSKTDGQPDFPRPFPSPIKISTSGQLTTAQEVVKTAIGHVRAIVKVDTNVTDENIPSALAGAEASAVILKIYRLALRELAEAAIVSLLTTGTASHKLDTGAVVKLLPWS